jgi:hypothetical protein
VLDHSDERLGNRLTLLALAEYAHDDGSKAFPSNETLQRRTRLSERSVRDSLRSLETNGAIIQTGATKSGTRVYTVIGPFNRGGQISPPAESAARGANSAPDPSRTVSPSLSGKSPLTVDGRKVDPAEDGLAVEVLKVFNRVSGRNFGSKEAHGKIIMRIREHPELALADHERVIVAQFERPWWKGDPGVNVIYGNGDVFDSALNGVRGRGDNDGDDGADAYNL